MSCNHNLPDKLMPDDLNLAILGMLESAVGEVFGTYGAVLDGTEIVRPIEYRARDGFIPFTDGGWAADVAFVVRPGDEVPRCLEASLESARDYLRDLAETECPEELEGADREDWIKEYEMYQAAPDAMYVFFRAQYYAPGSGFGNYPETGSVLFRAGWTADEYGRENHATWEYSQEYALPLVAADQELALIKRDMLKAVL